MIVTTEILAVTPSHLAVTSAYANAVPYVSLTKCKVHVVAVVDFMEMPLSELASLITLHTMLPLALLGVSVAVITPFVDPLKLIPVTGMPGGSEKAGTQNEHLLREP